MIRVLALSVVLLWVLPACTEDTALDYCKNHYRFHQDHVDGLAFLHIELDAEGVLSSELDVPVSALGLDTPYLLEMLEDPARVYAIESLQSCEPPEVAFGNKTGQDGTSLVVNYTSQCGSGDQVKQVDILLFDAIPELDEVETRVITTATQKHFAISRQCSSAIFRLHQGPDSQ